MTSGSLAATNKQKNPVYCEVLRPQPDNTSQLTRFSTLVARCCPRRSACAPRAYRLALGMPAQRRCLARQALFAWLVCASPAEAEQNSSAPLAASQRMPPSSPPPPPPKAACGVHFPVAMIEGRSLLLGGAPLNLQGVCWHPFSRGRNPLLGDEPEWKSHLSQDAALMRAAGVNVVRTYAMITDTTVLDGLWAYGVRVVMTVVPSVDASADEIHAALAGIASIKCHPAVLMWLLFDAPNLRYGYSAMATHDRVRELVQKIRDVDTLHRPIAISWGDLPTAADLVAMPNVDIWGLSVYRGSSFSALPSQWAALSVKPAFLSEYGVDSFAMPSGVEDQQTHAREVGAMTRELYAHLASNGRELLGGMYFELTDAWWRHPTGRAGVHDIAASRVTDANHSDPSINKEWFGLCTIDRKPKLAFHAFALALNPFYVAPVSELPSQPDSDSSIDSTTLTAGIVGGALLVAVAFTVASTRPRSQAYASAKPTRPKRKGYTRRFSSPVSTAASYESDSHVDTAPDMSDVSTPDTPIGTPIRAARRRLPQDSPGNGDVEVPEAPLPEMAEALDPIRSEADAQPSDDEAPKSQGDSPPQSTVSTPTTLCTGGPDALRPDGSAGESGRARC